MRWELESWNRFLVIFDRKVIYSLCIETISFGRLQTNKTNYVGQPRIRHLDLAKDLLWPLLMLSCQVAIAIVVVALLLFVLLLLFKLLVIIATAVSSTKTAIFIHLFFNFFFAINIYCTFLLFNFYEFSLLNFSFVTFLVKSVLIGNSIVLEI